MKLSRQEIFATLLGLPVFSFSVWNFIRFYAAITRWEMLQRLGANPLYLAGTGFGWGLALFVLLLALLGRWKHACLTGAYVSLLYFAFYWFERLRLQDSPAKNLPFSVITSISVFLLVTAFFLVAAKEESK